MKVIISLLVIALLFILDSCQNTDGPIEKKECESDSIIAFVNTTMLDFLWIGVENPIEVITSGYVDSIIVESDSLTKIRKCSRKGSYIINIILPKKVSLSVYGFTDGIKRKLCTQEFRTKPLPNGEVFLGGKRGKIKKEWLLIQTGIQVPLINYDYNIHFKVVEFTICTYKNGQMIENKSDSHRFTKEQKEQLRLLNSGEKFYIEDVKAKYPDGSIRNHGTVKYIIE